MNARQLMTHVVAFGAVASFACAPVTSYAQSKKDLQHRQEKKNEWRNIAYGAAALGIWGLLKHDNTLFFAGTTGALYSAWRYEQDRKSQGKMERARAQMFSRSYFYRNGVRYDRHTKWKNGKKYYYFAKHINHKKKKH